MDGINNYRQISILSSLSTISKNIINNRLNNFLTKYDLISDYQFGFCKKMFTTLALTDIYIYIINFKIIQMMIKLHVACS